MTNPLKTAFAEDVALFAARFPLGVYFAIAGYNKISKGATAFAESSMKLWPTWLPEEMGRVYLNTLPYAELVAGIMLAVGFVGRLAGGLVFLMLLSITIALGVLKDPDALGLPFHTNYILLGLALIPTVMGSGGLSADRFLFSRRMVGKPSGK